MRRFIALTAVMLAVAIGSSSATANVVRREEADESQKEIERVRFASASDIQSLQYQWGRQLEHLHVDEPEGRVGTVGHATPGLYLARIVDVDPSTLAITVDWLGHGPLDKYATNSDPTTQTLAWQPMSAVFLQQAMDKSLSGFQGADTIPVSGNVQSFVKTMRSRDASSADLYGSAWWVETEADRWCGDLMQSTLTIGGE